MVSEILIDVWRLNPESELHFRHWDNEWTVFDVGSGQTHQMDTLTAATLMMFESGPSDISRLASQLADELSLPNNRELSTALTGIVERLVATGLIEVTAP